MKKVYLVLLSSLLISILFSGCSVSVTSVSDESTVSEVVSETTIDSTTSSDSDSFIQPYRGKKYPVTSGMRKYIGTDPYRIYPNKSAPFVTNTSPEKYVELIDEVGVLASTEDEYQSWCLVIDSDGISGYVLSTDLKPIEATDIKDYNNTGSYGSGKETLGGFKPGDRIETMIGILDRDYYLIYENGRIYEFPDSKKTVTDDPIDRPFSEALTIDAFPDQSNHITLLRTSSPLFTLADGYKVGDNANTVLAFYKKKYQYIEKPTESDLYAMSNYIFILEDKHYLYFYIDTEVLTKDSKIKYIYIN